MLRAVRLATILTVSSVAILAAPFMAGGVGGLDLPGYAAHAEKGGNGGGNGGGGGDGNGNGGNGGGGGGESHGKSGESHGKSGGSHGKSAKSGDGTGSGDTVAAVKRKAADAEPSERNLRAQLAGLNSLKRNVNGLMNSSDPRMEGVREFIKAGAALEVALEELEDAKAAYEGAKAAYLELVNSFSLAPYDEDSDAYAEVSVSALEQRLTDLIDLELAETDADYDAWQAEIESLENAIPILAASEELTDLADAGADLDDATAAVETAEAASDDDALKEALLLAANDNRVAQYGEDYLTDEILDWAKSVLGVGDASGAIDAYLEQQ
jgi:hypothetical protein